MVSMLHGEIQEGGLARVLLYFSVNGLHAAWLDPGGGFSGSPPQ